MKVRTLILASVVLALPSATFAVELDCKWVALELEAGRTPKELIAMMSGLHPGLQDSDVKACRWKPRHGNRERTTTSPSLAALPLLEVPLWCAEASLPNRSSAPLQPLRGMILARRANTCSTRDEVGRKKSRKPLEIAARTRVRIPLA
jgi:hypothetical protein